MWSLELRLEMEDIVHLFTRNMSVEMRIAQTNSGATCFRLATSRGHHELLEPLACSINGVALIKCLALRNAKDRCV
eukprot:2310614-Prorocentrum_lima.AAC.1